MTNELALITKAALLHDVGKVCIRATREYKSHAVLGADFLQSLMKDSVEDKQLLRCVRYHHTDQLIKANLETDDLAYIINEANTIASGIEQHNKEDSVTFLEADPTSCLENIFNLFDGEGEDSYFPLRRINEEAVWNFPKSKPLPVATQGVYSCLLGFLKDVFQKRMIEDIHPNELLRILEDTFIYIPSNINKKELRDISLYEHIKITAAVATSLFRYFKNHGITDYQDFCWKNGKENRNKNTMLFVSGDFSGIQKFIYRVQTKGAMRMLRGRSFYLDFVLESIIDEILGELTLSRANLIYCGGGHFYFLADNSEETKAVLEKAFNTVNYKLVEMFSTSLYLAFAWEEICADDLMIHKTWTERNIFQRVGEKLSEAKLKRYDAKTLSELFQTQSPLNITRQDSRECGICHRSVNNLKPYLAQDRFGEDERVEVCSVCNGLYQLGKDILDHKTMFAVVDGMEISINGVELPSPFGKHFLVAVSKEDLEQFNKKGSLINIYEKNSTGHFEITALRLWIGDYAVEKDKRVLELTELAELAGGVDSETGIKRLGVLRADVDNLGAAFIAGLRKTEIDNPDFYATLPRYSTLSREMSMFFKRVIVDICKKQLPEGLKPFYIFQNKEKSERLLHIIYSGGDDIFVVGAWDDLLEFAVDLRKTFQHYTNGKLSFSAGLGLFNSAYPVSRMAEATGKLEDAAKQMDGKDGIALFGESMEYRTQKDNDPIPVFKWNEFEERVCNEKLRFLLNHFALEGISEDTGTNLKVGKSLLYRLLVLLSAPYNGKFNLARFAYMLARLEPDKKNRNRKPCYQEVRKQLFYWAQEEKSKKELVAAIRLIIYRLRDK